MKPGIEDLRFYEARLARRPKWARPLTAKLLPPSAALDRAINARAGIRHSRQWSNTVALLALVRSNQAAKLRGLPGESEPATLTEYMVLHTGPRHLDTERAPYYRRMLRRLGVMG
jgi:hypothetical protein